MSTEAHLHAQAEKRLGTSLRGKWRLERVLGVGGMGAVYEARHKNGKRVAVKILHAHLAAEPRILKRFVREGYVANALAHPAVVSIDDNDIDEEGNAFLVMELLQGETLEQRRVRAGGKLTPQEMLPVFALLLDVLVVAGDLGIVHRDLKPENLFLSADGGLRVVDFGLARAREVGLSVAGSLTNPDELLGTPAFMAPEQAIGRWDLVDARTDVWAAGATMFTVFAGRPVHDGGSVPVLLVSAATKKAPPLASVAPEIHPLVASMVDRALSFSKAERPEAREVLADLVHAARVLGIPLPDLPPRPASSAPPALVDADDDEDERPVRSSLRRQISSAPPSSLQSAKRSPSADPSAFAPTLADTPRPAARDAAVRAVSPSFQGSVPAVVVPVAIVATLIGAGVAAAFLRPTASPQPAATSIPSAAAASSSGATAPSASPTPPPEPGRSAPLPSASSAYSAPAPHSATAPPTSATPRKLGTAAQSDADTRLQLERRK